jgi:hypothetical protein
MIHAFAFALVLAAPSGQDSVYSNPELGFAMTHPSTWQVSTRRGDSRILIPIGTTGDQAILEIYGAMDRSEPDVWQTIQLRANEQLKREVRRQWQEEILGVPLLLTKVAYENKGTPTTALVGLLYVAKPRKMMFRLTSPSEHYDSMEFEFRSALQTLRTLDNTLPRAEDPSKPLPTTPTRTTRPTVITSVRQDAAGGREVQKGEVAVPTRAAGREVVLHLAAGWAAAPHGEEFVVTHPDLKGTATVRVESTLDSVSPLRALFLASGQSLQDFTKVARRDEPRPRQNRAGAQTNVIWRFGQKGAEDLTTCEAVGSIGDFYWVLTYRFNGKLSAGEQKLLESLVDAMSVDRMP